jgi:hypothetical protein
MCTVYAGLNFDGASYSRNAFDTSLPTQIDTLRRVWNSSTGKAIALGRVHQDDVSAVAIQVSTSRPRGCSRFSSGDLYMLLTTDMNAGVAGYRKQSVCCGRSIRCDAQPAHIAVHPMPFCENNCNSLTIFGRRQGALEPLVCAQRRVACGRSGGAAGCSGAVGAKRIRRCGGH